MDYKPLTKWDALMPVVICFRGHVPPEGDLKRLVSFDLQAR